MSVTKVWNHGQVIWQSGTGDDVPNSAILVHIDNGGTICLEQDEETLVIDRGSIEELVKVLRKLAKEQP